MKKVVVLSLLLAFLTVSNGFSQDRPPAPPAPESGPSWGIAASLQPFFWPSIFVSGGLELQTPTHFALYVPFTYMAFGSFEASMLFTSARLRYYFNESLSGFYVEGGAGTIFISGEDTQAYHLSMMMGVKWVLGGDEPKGTFTQLSWGYGKALDQNNVLGDFTLSYPLIAFNIGYTF